MAAAGYKRRDYYEVLGVEKDAELSAIKLAYRKLALEWHPGTRHRLQLKLVPCVYMRYKCLHAPEYL